MLAVEGMEQAAQHLAGGNFVALQSQNGTAIMQVRPQGLRDVIIALRDGEETRLNHLSYITAFDRHPLTPRFELVYELYSVEYRHRIRIKCQIEDSGDEKRLPQIDSIADLYLTANWHERETFDLFGINFRNHPDPRRILLPDFWDGHPLRKEYPFDGKAAWKLGTTVQERKGSAEISLGLEPDTDEEDGGDGR